MSLSSALGQIAIEALPTVIDLVDRIAESADQKAAAERAVRAVLADAADTATDKAVDEALKRL